MLYGTFVFFYSFMVICGVQAVISGAMQCRGGVGQIRFIVMCGGAIG